ncbi:MAG: hypothetical protein ACRD3S_06195 [Terracidiphilus sp.]
MVDVDALGDGDALDATAELVDHAFDQGDLDLNARALEWCETLAARALAAADLATLDYFRANIGAHRQQARHSDRTAAWSWDQEELQQQVFFLRRTLNSPAFPELHVVRRCQVLTNLGNQLDIASASGSGNTTDSWFRFKVWSRSTV